MTKNDSDLIASPSIYEEKWEKSCSWRAVKKNVKGQFLAVHMSPPQGKKLGDVCHGNLRGLPPPNAMFHAGNRRPS